MLTIADHIAELTKRFPLCNPREASETFFYSHQQLCRDHAWPFTIAEGRIVTEAGYAEGTVTVTNSSTAVTGADATWLTAWTTAPSMRRMIIEGRSEAYRVSAIASATSLTLLDTWVGDSDSELTYRMYRDIYALPANCGYGGEYILVDPVNRRSVKLKNFGSMIDRSIRGYGVSNVSTWASRVDLTSTGIPQLQFDPPPSDLQVFPVLYFRSATKPANITLPPDPLFPADAEHLITKRMLLEYAKDPRHKRADWKDFRDEYDDEIMKAMKKFDGGAELDTRLQTTYPDCSEDVFYLTIGEATL